MKILITGTPSVGKSTLTNLLSTKYNYKSIDISKLIIENKLYKSIDESLDTHVFSTKKVKKYLKKNILDDDFIIETHTPECVININFDIVIVLKTPLIEIKKRLEQRGYSKEKIEENLEVEIFNEIGYFCEDNFENVFCIGSEDNVFDAEIVFLNAQKIVDKHI